MAKHRLSVPIDPETMEVFQRMAEVMGKSLGSTISDWLAESRDSAEMVTVALMKAKQSPAAALRELQALAEAAHVRLGDVQGEMHVLARDFAPTPAPDKRREPAGGGTSGAAGGAPTRRRAGGGR